MKKIIVIIGIIGFAGLAMADFYEKSSKQPRVINKTVSSVSATGTVSTLPQFKVYDFDSEYVKQGSCLKIKDSDGAGYTFLTVNNGVADFSQTSCE